MEECRNRYSSGDVSCEMNYVKDEVVELLYNLVLTKVYQMKAVWNGQVIAESENTLVIEGNHYFPIDSVKKEYLNESGTTSVCPWKGTANYYNLKVEGAENPDAVWYYATPSELAKGIKDRVAFWKGVTVEA